MLLEETISKRVSIRKWQDKKIEREKLLNVMEAARRATPGGTLSRGGS
jgi:nitroreductase